VQPEGARAMAISQATSTYTDGCSTHSIGAENAHMQNTCSMGAENAWSIYSVHSSYAHILHTSCMNPLHLQKPQKIIIMYYFFFLPFSVLDAKYSFYIRGC